MSDYDSSGSELNRAIALSLQDAKETPVINLLSDDEDDDLRVSSTKRLATAEIDKAEPSRASKEKSSSGRPDVHCAGHRKIREIGGFSYNSDIPQMSGLQASDASMALQTSQDLSCITGVDRKRMEEERLERVRKRKAASISSTPPLQQPIGLSLSDKVVVEYVRQPSLTPSSAEVEDDWRNVKKPKVYKQPPSDSSGSKEGNSPWRQRGSTKAIEFLVPRRLAESKPLIPAGFGQEPLATGQEPISKEISNTGLPKVLSYKEQMDMLATGIHFPHGTVKKTWAYGYPRQGDIKIEEVLQKNDLELAVLSAYQWDEEWILSKLNMRKTKIICIVQAERESQKQEILANAPPNIRFCFPSMTGQINCMHSKLQLLSHPTHLRIVVPSANLVPYDWGEEGGIIENIVFMIDLPRLQDNQKTTLDEITPFGRELRHFLMAMELEQVVVDSILNFDFSRTAHLAFIHSIGGSHSGKDWKRTGYCGLGSAIKELGLATKHALEIDFVTSSMGNINNDFIKSIYLAAQGDDGATELEWRLSRPPKSKTLSMQPKVESRNTELLVSKAVEKGFRIYFPTRETVASSKGGIITGGTICLQKHWYDSPIFPRSLIRDCKSQRPRLLMHNKIIFVRPHGPLRYGEDDKSKEYAAWAYVGSANLSESAWGRLVMDKITKQPKLNIRNWECGVVIPVPIATPHHHPGDRESESKGKRVDKGVDGSEAGPPGMGIFDGVVPVPMVIPGEEYGTNRPWLYMEH